MNDPINNRKMITGYKALDYFNAPWSLRVEKDGIEDVAVICDADGDELLRCHHFWQPVDHSVPLTLAAARLTVAAPALIAALLGIIDYAENEALCLEKLKDSPEAEGEAKRAWIAIDLAHAAIAQANAKGILSASSEPDIDALL